MSKPSPPPSARAKPSFDPESAPLLTAPDPATSTTSWLPAHPDAEAAHLPSAGGQDQTPVSIISLVAIFCVGSFVSNADASFVIATHSTIASEFDSLSFSSWIMSTYTLAACISQPIYGKVSDLYGRKSVLTAAYVLFALGCALCGLATSFRLVLLGRVVSGIGGAGMSALVTIIITDLVPLREVASWRSYLNIAATSGRSLGGPIGGYLADTIGWRWSFVGQAPLISVAIILSLVLVPASQPNLDANDNQGSKRSRLARIDFLGALFLALTVLAFLVPLGLGGEKVPWSHPLVISCFGLCLVFGCLFVVTEKYWATEPIFPLHLLRKRAVVTAYLALALQITAQGGLMFNVPIYFQVTDAVSSTVAGAHLMPAFVGNVLGGLSGGVVIRR
ncbi:MAG: hypothetical protein M1822_006554 [Bathelium mastoideum]|nr:MAG: hypothetical protein M1822_006554 [Bathelium mastoideum]